MNKINLTIIFTATLRASKVSFQVFLGHIEKEIFADLKSALKEEDGEIGREDNSYNNTKPTVKETNPPAEQLSEKYVGPPDNLPTKETSPHTQPQQEEPKTPAVEKEKTRPYSVDPYREPVE